MKETLVNSNDGDFPRMYEYEESNTAPCLVRRLWVDAFDGLWVESCDGQRVVIPKDIRKLVAKRMKGE
jgi:hypothetical protein